MKIMAKPIRYVVVNGVKKPIYAEDENGNPICGKILPDGTMCTLRAGEGTEHVGYGRCFTHGGSSGSRPGDKSGMKDGMFSAIWLELLDPTIIKYWDNMRTDTLEQVNNEIKLCDARIYYLLGKIKDLQDNDNGEFVCVEKKLEDYKEIPVESVILTYYKALDAVQMRKLEVLKVKAKLEDSDPEAGNIDNMMSLVSVLHNSKKKVSEFKEVRQDEID